jgi:hypothetical protein
LVIAKRGVNFIAAGFEFKGHKGLISSAVIRKEFEFIDDFVLVGKEVFCQSDCFTDETERP